MTQFLQLSGIFFIGVGLGLIIDYMVYAQLTKLLIKSNKEIKRLKEELEQHGYIVYQLNGKTEIRKKPKKRGRPKKTNK